MSKIQLACSILPLRAVLQTCYSLQPEHLSWTYSLLYRSGIGFRCSINFYLLWLNSNLQRNRFIELSSELGAPILDRCKRKIDFGVFWLGLSNFWIGAWLPFDVFHFRLFIHTLKKIQDQVETYNFLKLCSEGTNTFTKSTFPTVSLPTGWKISFNSYIFVTWIISQFSAIIDWM